MCVCLQSGQTPPSHWHATTLPDMLKQMFHCLLCIQQQPLSNLYSSVKLVEAVICMLFHEALVFVFFMTTNQKDRSLSPHVNSICRGRGMILQVSHSSHTIGWKIQWQVDPCQAHFVALQVCVFWCGLGVWVFVGDSDSPFIVLPPWCFCKQLCKLG